MEIAMFYICTNALLAVIILSVLILIVLTVFFLKKYKNVGKFFGTVTVAVAILGCMLTVWICSHRSYPLINDWGFLGRDINSVEQEYGKFRWCSVSKDGSGYAVLETEKITGTDVNDFDSDCYYMEFDQDGKITKVYCGRPLGG